MAERQRAFAPSLGEVLAGRPLESEPRNGIPHYLEGQHRARLIEPSENGQRTALLTYVNAVGAIVAVVCVQARAAGSEWKPLLVARADHSRMVDWQAPPAEFELSGRMLEALREAEADR